MKAKVLVLGLVISVAAFMGPLNSTSFSGDFNEKAKFYEGCIDREILKCESKVNMFKSSRSKNLQNYATIKAQKAEFLKNEKEALVKEMIEMRLDQKHYKIERFLNSRFHDKI